MSLYLFSVFYLNLSYSSIEEKQHSEVLDRCYWPLLKLVEESSTPIGVEASGSTLGRILQLDPSWLAKLQELIQNQLCEFVGSGYSQLIGPLVPANVNRANLELGNQVYRDLLGDTPRIALVNEQAYSAGLALLYREAGYEALIMEWDNPHSQHPEWDPEWRYRPQPLTDSNGLTVLWNGSISFQKFQRFAHGELDLEEYLEYLKEHCCDQPRAFSVYGNDAEVFDFRPGRFRTESVLHPEGEWNRLGRLFSRLNDDSAFETRLPCQILDSAEFSLDGPGVRLESAAQPISVKKQPKYNITRWAVTGRDDVGINTLCHQIHRQLSSSDDKDPESWRELCRLWSSDFRTHITDQRWREFRERLIAMERRTRSQNGLPTNSCRQPTAICLGTVHKSRHRLQISTDLLNVKLNLARGLAIEHLSLRGDPRPWCGTLHHGYYDDIGLGADWYTGHLIYEKPGEAKITDLVPVNPQLDEYPDRISVQATIPLQSGLLIKHVVVYRTVPDVDLFYHLNWTEPLLGSLRLGHVTLHPETFDRSRLHYATHNGGVRPEIFALAGSDFDQGSAVSSLISASAGLGMTEGFVELGDHCRQLRVEIVPGGAQPVGLIRHLEPQGSYFCRLAFSLAEMDETRKPEGPPSPTAFQLRLRLASSL